MKPSIVLVAFLLAGLCSCAKTTLSNRRDMYEPQVVMGPYTRMVKYGVAKERARYVTVTTTRSSGDGKAYAPPR